MKKINKMLLSTFIMLVAFSGCEKKKEKVEPTETTTTIIEVDKDKDNNNDNENDDENVEDKIDNTDN
ncbi:hypothetical protein [Anaerococcus octavius]|uniref:hypothetical protein n=1 Tax=Anaerococcus octavius TaxID=54007 RepID=UPI002355E0B8|nr:hypothetical protein [Anaerococcus octavius]